MNNQVLSIEQMQELQELGIDTSKASAFYYPNYGEYYEHHITKKYVHDIKSYNPYPSFVNGNRTLKDLNPDLFPAFILQDILEMLPHYIEGEPIEEFETSYSLNIDFSSKEISYYDYIWNRGLISFEYDNLLDGAFQMLKWCKENKYI